MKTSVGDAAAVVKLREVLGHRTTAPAGAYGDHAAHDFELAKTQQFVFGFQLTTEAGVRNHPGGPVQREYVELDEEYRETAVRCAQIMGLNVAGVDMLEGKDGPQVMEVNSSPGLEGIETCTELDIAGAVVDYIAAQVDFPEIDVRQRLTVSKGYGVSEIYIPEGSEFVGKTVADFQLNYRELNVLTLYRATRVIPNPRLSRELEAEDKLLCFGKLEVMRGMIPVRTRRRRRPVPQDLPELDDSGSVAA